MKTMDPDTLAVLALFLVVQSLQWIALMSRHSRLDADLRRVSERVVDIKPEVRALERNLSSLRKLWDATHISVQHIHARCVECEKDDLKAELDEINKTSEKLRERGIAIHSELWGGSDSNGL